MKRLVRAAASLGLSAAVLVGAVGFAHTPAGRPMLRALGRVVHGGCPLGYDRALTPADRERAAHVFARNHHGDRTAPQRPALGFALDKTTRAEIIATMAKQGVACSAARGAADLTCTNVPSETLAGASLTPPTRNLWFTFGAKQQLLSLVSISRAPAAAPISDAFLAAERTISEQAGAPTQTHGGTAPEALAAGLLSQESAEFRFANYYALARASNLGESYLLTEEYRSLRD